MGDQDNKYYEVLIIKKISSLPLGRSSGPRFDWALGFRGPEAIPFLFASSFPLCSVSYCY